MQTKAATHSESRWVPLKTFCYRVDIKLRTGRYWEHTGKLKLKLKLKIKPKSKPKEHVFVDRLAWNMKSNHHF